MVIEILSPNTSVKDQREKLVLYERYGIEEYWIVDPQNQVVSVYILLRGAYTKPAVYGPEDTMECATLEGWALKLSDILGGS